LCPVPSRCADNAYWFGGYAWHAYGRTSTLVCYFWIARPSLLLGNCDGFLLLHYVRRSHWQQWCGQHVKILQNCVWASVCHLWNIVAAYASSHTRYRWAANKQQKWIISYCRLVYGSTTAKPWKWKQTYK
jgi:hypothetical protein